MCNDGEKVIESDTFCGLNYLIKEGQIVLISENNVTFSFSLDCFEDLTKEIKEILDLWGDIKTKKCYMTGLRRKGRRKHHE
jgi:hypothetical protein